MKPKITKFILLITLSLLLFNCSDDDNKDDLSSLKQTSWRGTYFVGEGENEIIANIGLAFYTEKKGYCDLKYSDGEIFQDTFDYSHDDKIVVIHGSAVSGNWFITSRNNKTMTLERGTVDSPSTKVRLVLEKEV